MKTLTKSMKLILTLSLCLALFLMTGTAAADTNVTLIRTNERGVSFRSTPNKPDDNSNKICGIHANVELEVFDLINGWYLVEYNGQRGYVSSDPELVTIIETRQVAARQNETASVSRNANTYSGYDQYSEEPYDMGIPYIGSKVYTQDQQNMVIFWVQTQMKATGNWYNGEIWDVTGNLGDHTMSEVASFMESRGYYGHRGTVDQQVIDELASYLGNRVQPVYVGGFYDYMNSIMIGGSDGSMNTIYSNMLDGIPHVTAGARWIQVVLKHLGYYNGGIDGKYGEGTENAVLQFQKNNRFEQRQYVTLGVARCMMEQYYYGGNRLNELP